MTGIPLTTFVEFSVSSGTARVDCVRGAKQDYDPRRDFYKALRERTINQFQAGWNAQAFRRSLQAVTDPKKVRAYDECRTGLTGWARGKTITAKRRHRGAWEAEPLDVKVNPELRLDIDGDDYVMKLYFKAPELTQGRREILLHLMAATAPRGATAAILDARRGDLYLPGPANPSLDPLLASDVAAYAALWNAL